MITVKNEQIIDAISKHPEKKSKLAIKADGSRVVLDKIVSSQTDFTLTAAHKIADYLGFDMVVEFVPRAKV